MLRQPAAPAMSYFDEVLADTPVSWFECNELVDVVAHDARPLANDGAYINAPTLGVPSAVDPGDTAVRLAHDDSQEIQIPWNAAYEGLLTVGGAFTLEFWVKFSEEEQAIASPAIASLYTNPVDPGTFGGIALEIGYFSGSMSVLSYDENSMEFAQLEAPGVADGEWHHVVFTRAEDGIMRLYVDGELVDDMPGPTQIDGANGVLNDMMVFGNSVGATAFLSGDLDEIAIYDYELDAARIAAHFENATQEEPVVQANLNALKPGGLVAVRTAEGKLRPAVITNVDGLVPWAFANLAIQDLELYVNQRGEVGNEWTVQVLLNDDGEEEEEGIDQPLQVLVDVVAKTVLIRLGTDADGLADDTKNTFATITAEVNRIDALTPPRTGVRAIENGATGSLDQVVDPPENFGGGLNYDNSAVTGNISASVQGAEDYEDIPKWDRADPETTGWVRS